MIEIWVTKHLVYFGTPKLTIIIFVLYRYTEVMGIGLKDYKKLKLVFNFYHNLKVYFL